ncbi:hypothetical protein GGR54DRAFT_601765 [Hypoxylon sp. NC1633]|nr:hypothetical protein GGR54DRAFT_601765 [Hypoxylon sp. NC1633]
MAELGRVAQLAFRSTPILRTSISRWPSSSYSIAFASPVPTMQRISNNPLLQLNQGNSGIRCYSSANWLNPSRPSRGLKPEDADIKKPDIPAYEDEFDLGMNWETNELNKGTTSPDQPVLTRPTLRLVPRTGRTIQVGKNSDVARSFKKLAIQVAVNRVKSDFMQQRYHERGGLKRKRLKSERWRKRFKMGFKHCVRRVKELTKQGW